MVRQGSGKGGEESEEGGGGGGGDIWVVAGTATNEMMNFCARRIHQMYGW